MKKLLLVVVLAMLSMALLVACGGDGTPTSKADKGKKKVEASEKGSTGKEEPVSDEPLSPAELKKMYANPDEYKGARVQFAAKIFVEPEHHKGQIGIQAYLDPDEYEQNIVIYSDDPDIDVNNGDIISVTGVVQGEFSGANAFGGDVTVPAIDAEHIEKTDYVTAFAEAQKEVDINDTQHQHGYKVTVEKMELAEKETRVYLSITNESKNKIEFYDFNTKLVADNKQHEIVDTLNDDYPQVQSEILPGVTSEGVLVFPKLDSEQGKVTLYLEGSSDNYELDFEPFQFEIKY
ncbi:hypothetical protein [Numidum massiliense]|uniref:hypothetical protein n=1 Tax=Numidum massiliense TaxID=1522315 RepID=UPI0006D55F51|nr:hypothetical protein [Numidum massiliense]